MQKYGIENFEVQILEKCSREILNDKEIYWIQIFDSTNYNKGYNITSGG